ncbi:MAG: tetratricopeptide repeat protein [Nitrospirota bacterium]|nr:tetratricopeptide repeat protein [Nitrospirota bacterium]
MAKIKKKSTKTHFDTTEELRSIAHNVSDQYMARKKLVNTVLLAVIALSVVAVIYVMINANQEKSAGMLVETAYASYSGSAGSGPNYDKALQGFQDVVKQYGSTLNGAIAQFYIGNTMAQMGRTDDAMKAYLECTKRYSGKKFISAIAFQRMGYLYDKIGKQEEAIAAFKQAEALSGAGLATVELAHLYEMTGKSKEALEKYKELTDKLPGTTFAMSARSKLPPPDLSAAKTAPSGTSAK